ITRSPYVHAGISTGSLCLILLAFIGLSMSETGILISNPAIKSTTRVPSVKKKKLSKQIRPELKKCRRSATAATAPAQQPPGEIRQLSGEGLVVASVDLLAPEPVRPRATDECRPVPDDQRAAVRVRNFLGEEPAIMMPVPLSWSSGQDGEQKYLRDMAATIPEFLKRNLEFDFARLAVQGHAVSLLRVEFGSASLHHPRPSARRMWRRPRTTRPEARSPATSSATGTAATTRSSGWRRTGHVKECRYCHSAVPWHALSQHEDECRSIMYGTTPTSTAQMSTGFSSDLMQQLAELDAKISQVYSAASASLFTTPAIWASAQLLMLNEGVNKLTILRQKLYFVKGKIMRSNQLNVLAYPASDLYMTGGEKESLTDLLRLILDQRFDLDEKLRSTLGST
uniref:MYND-type domain-containing protein n=1 Tax=Macrostomum lignano TaxID=282301 RepID=A0A1I8F9G5_9PLAT